MKDNYVYGKGLTLCDIIVNTKSVRIPYSPALLPFICNKDIRIRRDIGKIFNLIKAHALLHQVNRKKDSEGDILATMMDYSVVRDLLIGSLPTRLKNKVLKDKLLPTLKDLRKEYKKYKTYKTYEEYAKSRITEKRS